MAASSGVQMRISASYGRDYPLELERDVLAVARTRELVARPGSSAP